MPNAPSAAPFRSPRLRVFLLGAFRLEREARRRAGAATRPHPSASLALPTRKSEALLAYLLLYPDAHPREQVAALLWGEVPDDLARSSLRQALVILRQAIGADLLLADRTTVQLNPAFPVWVDALEFQAQAQAFLNADNADSAIHLGLYRGDLLEECYDDWIAPRREHLRSLHLRVLLALAQRWRARAEYGRAIDLASQVLAREAGNEVAHQIVMFCFATLGQHGEALQQFERCRRALQEELGVEPSPETLALLEWIKAQRESKITRTERVTNLPRPLTSFIGRERELAELESLLQTARLLTLTGAGGCGKTRLAIQLAARIAHQFKDGVWWVELAPLHDGVLVPQAIAQSLGVRESPHESLLETLTHFLEGKRLLLILDNCEHLLDACAHVSEILITHCPDLRVLATSRQSFNLSGEIAWIVPSLALPAAQLLAPEGMDKETIAALDKAAAVRLFVERARAVKPDFQLTLQNAFAVGQICQRLDGIPLAIELAAARTKLLTPGHIAARLDDRFTLLTNGSRAALPRHQTLRATIDWSYDLLPEDTKKLFRRLAVFAGGFTLEAAETICGDDALASSAVLNELARLVDRSLVLVEQHDGNERYHMLETIREYAREKLIESDESDLMSHHHLDFFLNLVEQAEPKLIRAERSVWLDRLEAEHNNLRAALEWSQTPSVAIDLALRLASALHWFWYYRGYYREGRSWLEGAYTRASSALPPVSTADKAHQAKVLYAFGNLTETLGYNVAARFLDESSVALWRELDPRDPRGLAYALVALARVYRVLGETAPARACAEEAASLFRQERDQAGLAYALINLGHVIRNLEEYDSARAALEEGKAIYDALGDEWGVSDAQDSLAGTALRQGDYDSARRLYEANLQLKRKLGDVAGIAYALLGLGVVALNQGDEGRAQELIREGEILFPKVGRDVGTMLSLIYDGHLALFAGNTELAESLYLQAIALARRVGPTYTRGMILFGLAAVASLRGHAIRAARMWGAAEKQKEEGASYWDAADRRLYQQTLAKARDELGAELFERARMDGLALTFEQAIDYALQT